MSKKLKKKDWPNGIRPFGFRDKFAYAMGDFGCNMSFALKGTLTLFWTQFMGITEASVAFLLVLVQIWDAINDPVIGSMIDADRKKYKRGKFLHYILIGSIGLVVAGALCFIPLPNINYLAKQILFVAGYIIWDAFYTIANVPYGSMLSNISEDAGDRAQLSSWRSIGSMVGNMVPMVILPMIIYDASNNLIGERVFLAALIMGVLGFFSFQIMIHNTVERVNLDITCKEDAPKFNFFKAMGNFLTNRAAIGATLAPVGMFIGMYGAQTSLQIMFQSYFKNAQISGLVSVIAMLPMFLFIPFIRKIVSKWGKKEGATVGAFVSVIGCALMLMIPMQPNMSGVLVFIICMLINGLGQGIYQCVGYSMMADAIDYNEWKHGVREEGTTYALHSFFRKLAQGVGPSAGLIVATWLGYDASLKADQPANVALNMTYMTAGAYLLSAVLMFIAVALVYNIDKKTLGKMQAELAVSRAAIGAAGEPVVDVEEIEAVDVADTVAAAAVAAEAAQSIEAAEETAVEAVEETAEVAEEAVEAVEETAEVAEEAVEAVEETAKVAEEAAVEAVEETAEVVEEAAAEVSEEEEELAAAAAAAAAALEREEDAE